MRLMLPHWTIKTYLLSTCFLLYHQSVMEIDYHKPIQNRQGWSSPFHNCLFVGRCLCLHLSRSLIPMVYLLLSANRYSFCTLTDTSSFFFLNSNFLSLLGYFKRYLFIWLHQVIWNLVPWPGIKPRFPCIGSTKSCCQTTREVPQHKFLTAHNSGMTAVILLSPYSFIGLLSWNLCSSSSLLPCHPLPMLQYFVIELNLALAPTKVRFPKSASYCSHIPMEAQIFQLFLFRKEGTVLQCFSSVPPILSTTFLSREGMGSWSRLQVSGLGDLTEHLK